MCPQHVGEVEGQRRGLVKSKQDADIAFTLLQAILFITDDCVHNACSGLEQDGSYKMPFGTDEILTLNPVVVICKLEKKKKKTPSSLPDVMLRWYNAYPK